MCPNPSGHLGYHRFQVPLAALKSIRHAYADHLALRYFSLSSLPLFSPVLFGSFAAMSGPQSFFFVDDSDLQSITYDTKDLWSPAELDGAYQGTVTKGVAGAKASLNFSGEPPN